MKIYKVNGDLYQFSEGEEPKGATEYKPKRPEKPVIEKSKPVQNKMKSTPNKRAKK